MKFANQFDLKRTRFYTNPGEQYKIEYVGQYAKNGEFELVENGKTDLHQYINSFKDSCDLAVILARYEAGDTSALNARPAFFGDVTNMPKSYAEMLNSIYQANKWFDTLPKEIKAKFDFSPEKFISEFDSPDFMSKLTIDNNVSNVQNIVEDKSAPSTNVD